MADGKKKPAAPPPPEIVPPKQQVADDGSQTEAETYANIEPDGVRSFANITPAKE